MPDRLSLIAGSGALVAEIIAAARRQGHDLQALSLEGRRTVAGLPALRFDVANPEPAFEEIRRFGATRVTLVGAIRLGDRNREALLRLFDAGSSSVGDTILSALAARLAEFTGAQLVGVQDIAPELLAPEGLIGGPPPADSLLETASFAIGLARRAGAIDVGQGIVISGRRTVAVEDIAGTDALLKRVAIYRRMGLAADGRSPLVFAKVAKPAQPLFVDLPAIGPVTVSNARRAGIALIAVQAGATLLIERQKLVAAAASAQLPIVGIRVADV